MCFGGACMSKPVSSTENGLYNFLAEEYVRIPHFKEIECCRVKATTNVLEIHNPNRKKSLIVQNYLVCPKQHVVTLCALVLGVFLSVYLSQRLHCTIFCLKNMCKYHIYRNTVLQNKDNHECFRNP